MENNEKTTETQGWKRISAWKNSIQAFFQAAGQKIPPVLRNFFLFQRQMEPDQPAWKHLLFWLWNSLPYLAATAGLGVVSLWFAASEYGQPMFDSYFELPALDSALDVLQYCWFMALYVDMESGDDEIAYAVEGEGEWGENIGFVISGDKVVYVGTDYLDYMKHAN